MVTNSLFGFTDTKRLRSTGLFGAVHMKSRVTAILISTCSLLLGYSCICNAMQKMLHLPWPTLTSRTHKACTVCVMIVGQPSKMGVGSKKIARLICEYFATRDRRETLASWWCNSHFSSCTRHGKKIGPSSLLSFSVGLLPGNGTVLNQQSIEH